MKKYDIPRQMFASPSTHKRQVAPTMGRRKFLLAGASLAAATALPTLTLAPSAEAHRSHDGLLRAKLRVRYARNRIGNLPVFTRTFEGRIPGPTLRLKPGDTLQLRLFNRLPPETHDHEEPMDINMPHRFNVTNLHFHGLHVSPKCSADGRVCSDNVLIEIEPGESQLFEVTLPENHPDGTYWYHPHKHGSAAIQVMGGMAGALIIEGDTDHFLKDHGVRRDRVFVLQAIRVDPAGRAEFINDFTFSTPSLFTVNGKLQPIIRIRPGEVQRWRFINAGEHEHMPLELRAGAGNAPQTFHQLAFDGITLPKLEEAQHLFLASGNRLDVLVKIDKPGVYRLIKPELNQGTPAAEFDSNGVPVLINDGMPLPIPEELIATVIVAGEPDDTPLPRGDLPRPSSALPPIQDREIDRARLVTFSIDFSTASFPIDGKLFDPNRVDQSIPLGAVEEWTVINTSPADHPFHIHQNPFLVTEIKGDPLVQPVVSLPLWLDTVNVPRNTGFPDMSHPGSVTFRSRFEDFDGKFVLHCHLIHHEDMGMMQIVEVG